jgi:hypothetical protein
MAEGTVLHTMSGATLAISASLPATYNAAGYGATAMVYTTVGEIENFGNHGVTANVTTFTAVANSVVQKFKGSKNYGTMNLVIGNMPSDAGQDIIETAAESTARYSVKISYPTRAGESTAEIHYLDVLVSKREFQDGAVDDVRKIAVDFEVCRAPVIVAAT